MKIWMARAEKDGDGVGVTVTLRVGVGVGDGLGVRLGDGDGLEGGLIVGVTDRLGAEIAYKTKNEVGK